MKKTPILFTIPNFITAGSGREMLNIIERLDRDRFAPAVCVQQKGGRLDAEVERLGFPLLEAQTEVPPRPYHSLPARTYRAAQQFEKGKYKIWHSFHWSSDYTEALIARWAGADAWLYTKKNMNWHTRAWHLRSLLASKVVLRNASLAETYFDGRLHRGKGRLIPGGVDLQRFHPDTPHAGRWRKALGIPEAHHLAACVAQLVPVKGQDTLIRTVAEVPGLHLLLAGRRVNEAYHQELRALVERLELGDRVHFLKHVDDVPALLAEVDCSVLPTSLRSGHQEGCPVALMEAMAAGKACIATDVAGSRDLIVDGTSGLLVAPDDVAALAAGLRRLLQDPALREAMGRAARQRMADGYSLDREAADFQQLYLDLLEGKA